MRLWERPARRLRSFQTAAPAGPSRDATFRRTLVRFLCELGSAMNAAGDATTFIQPSLERISRKNGLSDLHVSAVPTLLLMRYSQDEVSVVDLTAGRLADLRLDQVTDIYRLAGEAEEGRIDPREGLARLHAALSRPGRFGPAARVAGLGLSSAGISLVLAPAPLSLVICLFFGLLVGTIRLLASHRPAVWPLVPVVSGGIVAAIGLSLVNHGVEVTAAAILIPPLAIFLPGAAITVAMIELSAGDIVSGGSRLAFGAARLFLLIFGIVVAAESLHWQGDPIASQTLPWAPLTRLLGVVLFTIGVSIHYSAPRGSFRWMLLVVLLAWGAQQLSGMAVNTNISAALAGAVMVIAAGIVERHEGAPPLIVSYTPAFWLLIPGSLGLRGFSELAQDNTQAALTDLFVMIMTMVAIALGMLVGLLLAGDHRMRDSV